MSETWNLDRIEYDMRPDAAPNELLKYYQLLDKIYAEHAEGECKEGVYIPGSDIMMEYLYARLGRRRWFISGEMFDIINSLKIDDEKTSFEEIHVPYDSMAFVTEKGTELKGLPFRFVIFSYPRSVLSMSALTELAPGYKGKGFVSVMVDCGLSGRSGADGKQLLDFDQERDDAILCGAFADPKHPIGMMKDLSDGNNALGNDFFNEAIRFVAKALMLYNARPEFVAPYELSRTQRYQFGNAESRKNIHRVMFPDKKLVRRKPEGYEPTPTGKHQPYHIRGWSLRTFRHEKFQRNPDGSFKVKLVAPYEVHPELKRN